MGHEVERVFIFTQEQFADDLFGARERRDLSGVYYGTGTVPLVVPGMYGHSALGTTIWRTITSTVGQYQY